MNVLYVSSYGCVFNRVYTCVRVYVRTYVCMYLYVYTNTCMCVCAYVNVSVRMYVSVYTVYGWMDGRIDGYGN